MRLDQSPQGTPADDGDPAVRAYFKALDAWRPEYEKWKEEVREQILSSPMAMKSWAEAAIKPAPRLEKVLTVDPEMKRIVEKLQFEALLRKEL